MSHQHTPSSRAGGTIRPKRFCKQSLTEDNTVLECDYGEVPVGICKEDNLEFDVDNHATDGLPVRFQQGSIMEVECGAAISRGYAVGPDADGRAIEDGGDFAIALQNGSGAGDIIEVLFNPHAKKLATTDITADLQLTEWQSGSAWTNLGATGTITATLPQSPQVGTYFDFIVMVAEIFRIDPGAGGGIYIAAAKQSDDVYIWANAIAESVRLIANAAGDWMAINVIGTWTVN